MVTMLSKYSEYLPFVQKYYLLYSCLKTYIGNPKAKKFIDMFNEIGKLPQYSVEKQTKGNMQYKFLQYNGMKTIQTVNESKLF